MQQATINRDRSTISEQKSFKRQDVPFALPLSRSVLLEKYFCVYVQMESKTRNFVRLINFIKALYLSLLSLHCIAFAVDLFIYVCIFQS